jgi:hypothetical protein
MQLRGMTSKRIWALLCPDNAPIHEACAFLWSIRPEILRSTNISLCLSLCLCASLSSSLSATCLSLSLSLSLSHTHTHTHTHMHGRTHTPTHIHTHQQKKVYLGLPHVHETEDEFEDAIPAQYARSVGDGNGPPPMLRERNPRKDKAHHSGIHDERQHQLKPCDDPSCGTVIRTCPHSTQSLRICNGYCAVAVA